MAMESHTESNTATMTHDEYVQYVTNLSEEERRVMVEEDVATIYSYLAIDLSKLSSAEAAFRQYMNYSSGKRSYGFLALLSLAWKMTEENKPAILALLNYKRDFAAPLCRISPSPCKGLEAKFKTYQDNAAAAQAFKEDASSMSAVAWRSVQSHICDLVNIATDLKQLGKLGKRPSLQKFLSFLKDGGEDLMSQVNFQLELDVQKLHSLCKFAPESVGAIKWAKCASGIQAQQELNNRGVVNIQLIPQCMRGLAPDNRDSIKPKRICGREASDGEEATDRKKAKLSLVAFPADENLGEDDTYDVCEETCLYSMLKHGVKGLDDDDITLEARGDNGEDDNREDMEDETDDDESGSKEDGADDDESASDLVRCSVAHLRDDFECLVNGEYQVDSNPMAEFITHEQIDEERDRVALAYLKSQLSPAYEGGRFSSDPVYRQLFLASPEEDGRCHGEQVDVGQNIRRLSKPVLIDLTKKQQPVATLAQLQSFLTPQESSAWSALGLEKPMITQSSDYWATVRNVQRIKKEAQEMEG